MAGTDQPNTPACKRGATIYTIAANEGDPWCVLARRALDELETRDDAERLLAARLTGRQLIAVVLHRPWGRRRFSLRALAGAAGVHHHAVEKHRRAALERLRAAAWRQGPPTPGPSLDAAWSRYKALERLMSEPPGSDNGGPRVEVSRAAFGALRIDRDGTHWPPEKWQPPAPDGGGYGPVQTLPQDEPPAPVTRRRSLKVDTFAAVKRRDTENAALAGPVASPPATRAGSSRAAS